MRKQIVLQTFASVSELSSSQHDDDGEAPIIDEEGSSNRRISWSSGEFDSSSSETVYEEYSSFSNVKAAKQQLNLSTVNVSYTQLSTIS